jgi:hypothetical protein
MAAFAGSSNGRTPDSGSGSLGSSPSPAALWIWLPKRPRAASRFLRRERRTGTGWRRINVADEPRSRACPASPCRCEALGVHDRLELRHRRSRPGGSDHRRQSCTGCIRAQRTLGLVRLGRPRLALPNRAARPRRCRTSRATRTWMGVCGNGHRRSVHPHSGDSCPLGRLARRQVHGWTRPGSDCPCRLAVAQPPQAARCVCSVERRTSRRRDPDGCSCCTCGGDARCALTQLGTRLVVGRPRCCSAHRGRSRVGGDPDRRPPPLRLAGDLTSKPNL